MNNEAPKPVIGMCQGANLLLLVDGRQIAVHVGSMIYAAELAEAINKVTGELMEEAASNE